MILYTSRRDKRRKQNTENSR